MIVQLCGIRQRLLFVTFISCGPKCSSLTCPTKGNYRWQKNRNVLKMHNFDRFSIWNNFHLRNNSYLCKRNRFTILRRVMSEKGIHLCSGIRLKDLMEYWFRTCCRHEELPLWRRESQFSGRNDARTLSYHVAANQYKKTILWMGYSVATTSKFCGDPKSLSSLILSC